jgi:hypothetical protein
MELDDWNDINIEVERDKKEFKLTQLKLNHYYWNSGEIDNEKAINTSVELISRYNIDTDKLEWKKIISHTYISSNEKETTDTYEEDINEEIIKEIEKYDLRDLKNNYFTEETPEKFTYWEITYNNNFKIVGTYDQEIDEFINIKRILDFNKIMKEEIVKIQNKLKQE